MTNIKFDEEQDFYRPMVVQKQPALVRLVLASGLTKTEQGANYLLLGIAVLCFVATFFVLFSDEQSKQTPLPLFQSGQSVFPPAGPTP